MKNALKNLQDQVHELTNAELMGKVYDLVEMIKSTDERLLSVSKKLTGYGTWKSVGFVNEYHFGEDLAKIIEKALTGTITHDEEKEFTISDFEEKLEEAIYQYFD